MDKSFLAYKVSQNRFSKKPRFSIILIFFVIAPFATCRAIAQTASSRSDGTPRTVYFCRSFSTNLGGDPGSLILEKSFFADGSVYRQKVIWEDHSGSFIRKINPLDRATATLSWPGDRFSYSDEPFDWSSGFVIISIGNDLVFSPRAGEQWRQDLIDRSGAVHLSQRETDKYIERDGSKPILATDLQPPSSPGLRTSLEDILAWATNTDHVSVYETLIKPRKYKSNEYPNSPAGDSRIVAHYDIVSQKLSLKIRQIHEATTNWTSSIIDYRSNCEKGIEQNNEDIVVN